ncbi:myristoyl transferase [Methylophaga sp. 42_25_T18]|nr:myristoyl transferase [Methylophaga sp. 42_25_T18]OUR85891.1 myristoyl transferase [Methylophaga sp. 42_8_T64]
MIKKTVKTTSLFLLILFSSLVAATEQVENSHEPVTLQLKWLHQFQFAGYYAALEQGFYADEGLDVTIKALTSDRDIVKDVVAGEVDYAVGDSGILMNYADGAPIRALAAIFQHNALVFVAKQSSGIISPYEMADKRIMFDAKATDIAPLSAVLAEAELDSKDYTSIPRSFNNQALINGDIDVMSAYITDQPFELQQQSIPINIINPQNYGYDFYGDLLYTSQAEIDNNPDRAIRFRRASLKGWRYALEHPEELIQLIKNKYGSTATVEHLRYEAKETRKLILPKVIPLGNIETSRLRRVANIYTQLKLAKPLDDSSLTNFIFNNTSSLLFSAEEQAWLDAHPVIRLGVDRDFAPYEWVNQYGNYLGLAADYMRLLESRLGVRFEIIDDKPWHEILAMAQRGEIDLLSCLNSSPERAQYLHFTHPYVNNPVVIINANRNGYVGTLKNLIDKTVSIEKGYFTYENLVANYPEINLLVVDSTFDALNKVNIGEADAYVGDAAYANYAIKQADMLNLQFAGQTNLTGSYRIGIHKSQPELHAIINRALNSISPEERKSIENNWLGLEVTSGIPIATITKVSVAIALLFLMFSHWVYRLRQTTHALQQSQTKLQSIIDASPIPHALNDNQHNITYLNQAFIDTFGYTLEDIPTLASWNPKAYPDPDYRTWVFNAWSKQFTRSTSNQKFEPIELKVQCKNGESRHVLASETAITEPSDDTHVVIFYDITERKQAEEQLRLSGRVFNEAHEGIIITDTQIRIVDVNPAFCSLSGFDRDEIIGQDPKILKSNKHKPEFYHDILTILQTQGHWQGEVWNRKKNGEHYATLLSISTLLDDQGEAIHYLALFSDITQSKQQQQTLEMMAHYDVLTQLPNRTLFADRFNLAIAHSKRNNSLLAVVFLDLDNFKPVNDNYGHEVGDQLLVEVAQRIKANIREEDTASRLGGDEFVLLLNEIQSTLHGEELVDRVHKAISEPYKINDITITISASSGITLFPLDDADADTLLRHADQAMYQAKLAGRNRHHMFDTLHDQQLSLQHNQLQSVDAGFNAQQFVLYYQPKINMRTGEVHGAEALIRWLHPERGLIPPLSFLPILEGTDLEIKVGNWVIDQALKQLDEWQQQGINLEISVNISSHHLQWEGFYQQLEQALSHYPQLSPHNLQLEILESSILSDITLISGTLKACRNNLGVRISLDDFGTGYSSLIHLRHLPVNVVKIDQTFVRDLIDDPNDYTIVDGIIGLTQSFHHEVIAEGVETTTHGLMLMLIGCDHAQGYGIARPMPAAEFKTWFNNYQANQDWLDFAYLNLSARQKLLTLLTIESKQWLSRMIASLESPTEEIQPWPAINHDQSLYALWLGQARNQQLFDPDWIERLEQAFNQLHQLGKDAKEQFLQGQIEQAQAAITNIQQTYAIIDELLEYAD